MRTKQRSLIAITLLTIVTLGLYQIYWYFITKTEMNLTNSKSAKVPFFLWFFIPIVNIWWFWRFAKAIEKSTKGSVGRWAAFFAPVVFAMASSLFLGLLYPSVLNQADFVDQTGLWGSLLVVMASLLPIYYFQSHLNKSTG